MEALATLLRLFPFNPVAATIIAVVFGVGMLRCQKHTKDRNILLVTAIVWGLYAMWEIYMLQWRSPSGDRAIRVDLVFLIPVMMIVGAVGSRSLWRALRRNK